MKFRIQPPLGGKGKVVKNKISPLLSLLFVPILLSGCVAVPFLPLLPVVGSAYQGYVVWRSGEATKYYAFDVDTTYRAVMQASVHLQLAATVIKSEPGKGYSLETKGKVPMNIDVLPVEKDVATVITKIPMFGDKNYVELFYKQIDDNLHKKAAAGEGKTP